MATRGRPFQEGNKLGRGRPLGSRNKKTLLIEELLCENSESLLQKALDLAQQGNVPMLRLLLIASCHVPKMRRSQSALYRWTRRQTYCRRRRK